MTTSFLDTGSGISPKDDAFNQWRTNCMAFACLTILVWDHMVTFGDEVEYVWKGRRGPFMYLFFLNRYLTPLGFTINIFAYLSPSLTPEVQYFQKGGSMTIIGINVVAIMMFYRVHVLYWRTLQNDWSRALVVALAFILLAEFCVNAWLLSEGVAVLHTTALVHGCEMIYNHEVKRGAASASAWLPLLYDTVAFVMIVWKTLPSDTTLLTGVKYRKQLLEDGVLYYCPIMLVTLVLALMIKYAPPGSQNLTAQLELVITVTMMSRITLNLKKVGHKSEDIDAQLASIPGPASIVFEHARAQVTSVQSIIFNVSGSQAAVQSGRDDDSRVDSDSLRELRVISKDIESGSA